MRLYTYVWSLLLSDFCLISFFIFYFLVRFAIQELICAVCLTETVTHCVDPCGHCVCNTCRINLDRELMVRCPICRLNDVEFVGIQFPILQNDRCVECGGAPIECIVKPCGHYAVCRTCPTSRIRNMILCPVCYETIQRAIRVYVWSSNT